MNIDGFIHFASVMSSPANSANAHYYDREVADPLVVLHNALQKIVHFSNKYNVSPRQEPPSSCTILLRAISLEYGFESTTSELTTAIFLRPEHGEA